MHCGLLSLFNICDKNNLQALKLKLEKKKILDANLTNRLLGTW